MKAVISGATKGIGRAIAKELAIKGYSLVLLARNEKDLEALVKELNSTSNQHECYSVNLANQSEIFSLANNLKKHEHIDLLINNLGIHETDTATKLKIELLQKLLETNLYSAISLTQMLLPLLKIPANSKIINIGSVLALHADSNSISYSISKHALKAWSDGLREELRPNKIAVSSIYPAAVNTSSWDGIEINRDEMIQAKDIAKLIGTMVDLSPACLVEEIKLSPITLK